MDTCPLERAWVDIIYQEKFSHSINMTFAFTLNGCKLITFENKENNNKIKLKKTIHATSWTNRPISNDPNVILLKIQTDWKKNQPNHTSRIPGHHTRNGDHEEKETERDDGCMYDVRKKEAARFRSIHATYWTPSLVATRRHGE